MAQLTLPHIYPGKYIIDASSIFSQKDTRKYPKQKFLKLWENIGKSMKEANIVTCSEIEEEIRDEEIKNWLHTQSCKIYPIDEEIQENVKKIVTEHPKMISFNPKKGSSSGDAFLIATAMKYHLFVITEEKTNKPYNIPKICESYKIESFNLSELCKKENWVIG